MSGHVNIGNLSGMGLVFKFPSGNTIHESLFIFTQNKNRLYTITFETMPAKIGHYVPIVYRILSSLVTDYDNLTNYANYSGSDLGDKIKTHIRS